jgi:hypothetical protein
MNSKLFIRSKIANENYLSTIIKIDNVRPHPNPKVHSLDIVTYQGGDVIVGRGSVKIGDIMVYCAVESALNKDFLSKNNQFEDKELNVDKKQKGYFNKKGRCRAINLQEHPSRGFLFSPEWLKVWQPTIKENNWEDYIGIEFDTVNDVLFSKKYVVEVSKPKNSTSGNKKNKRDDKLKRFDKLIENQFKFHYDTDLLVKNLSKIQPDDIISISSKFHGTSSIFSNVLIKRELNIFEKFLKRWGVKIETKEYGDIISSRGVVKNRYINKNVGTGFYSVDVWTEASKKVLPLLAKGETVYAEIVGFQPGRTKYIQEDHDYKCNEGEFEIYVYRVTLTNPDGVVYELSASQVQQWCNEKGLNPVKQLYYGKAKDLYDDLDTECHWHENFFERLKNDKENFYMELDSPDCNNPVPHEGIVIRNDSNNNMKALKLKTERHYLLSTKQMDKGIVDIEDVESMGEEENGGK